MNESWEKHIQPILDTWPYWNNFSWIWDPIFRYYPNFSDEQKEQVDDALVDCSFDTSHESLAIKALGIAGVLQNNNIASPRLVKQMRKRLLEKAPSLVADSNITSYYVTAIRFFGVKEAIPYIQQLVLELEEKEMNGMLDERPSPQGHTFRHMLEKYESIIQEFLNEDAA